MHGPQAVADLARCIAQGRAQAQALTLLALGRGPAEYAPLCQPLQPGQLRILDCFSDPFGWLARRPADSSGAAATAARPASSSSSSSVDGVMCLPGVLEQRGGLHQLAQALACPPGPGGSAPPPLRQAIVIDSLSKLLDSHGAPAVCQWLHGLQRDAGTSCVLCALHADVHSPQASAPRASGSQWPCISWVVAKAYDGEAGSRMGADLPAPWPALHSRQQWLPHALRRPQALSSLHYLATGRVQLQPLSELERSMLKASHQGPGPGAGPRDGQAGAEPHGRATVRLKRRAGRVRVEAQLYSVLLAAAGRDPAAWVAYWDAPAAATAALSLAGAAAAAAAGASCVRSFLRSLPL